MPIPAPGTVDSASQTTLVAVKEKTDLIDLVRPTYFQLLPRRGIAVVGTWTYITDAGCGAWLTDSNLDAAGLWRNSSSTQNDEYAYPIVLPPGGYTFEIYYLRNTDGAILELKLGSTSLGTVDLHNAAPQYNTIAYISFTVATTTAANLRILASSKNGASTGYTCHLQKMTLWRTA